MQNKNLLVIGLILLLTAVSLSVFAANPALYQGRLPEREFDTTLRDYRDDIQPPVTSAAGDLLLELPLDFIDSFTQVYGVAFDAPHLFVSTGGREVFQVATDGTVIAIYDFSSVLEVGIYGLAWDGTHLWAGLSSHHIAQLDLTTETVITSFPSPGLARAFPIYGLTYDPTMNALWHSDSETTVWGVDRTGSTIDRITLEGRSHGEAFDGICVIHHANFDLDDRYPATSRERNLQTRDGSVEWISPEGTSGRDYDLAYDDTTFATPVIWQGGRAKLLVYDITPCAEPVCGNGLVEGEEQCDDGNLRDGDGCSAECKLEPEFCIDSDGGIVPDVRGIAEDSTGRYPDLCKDDAAAEGIDPQDDLLERYCDGNRVAEEWISCPDNACLDGACI